MPPSSHANVRFSHLSKFFPEIFEPTESKLGLNVTFVVLIIFYDFCFIWKFKMTPMPIMFSDWLKLKNKISENQISNEIFK